MSLERSPMLLLTDVYANIAAIRDATLMVSYYGNDFTRGINTNFIINKYIDAIHV